MLRDIEVENLTTIMTDHEEAVEHAEPGGWNGEKVHRRNGLPMIPKKGQPAFGSLWISRCSFHPAGDGSLRNIETQHEKLAVDARRTPGRILRDHPKDQSPNFLRNFLSANYSADPGDDFPI